MIIISLALLKVNKGGGCVNFEAELGNFLGQSTVKKSIQKVAITAMKAGGSGVVGSLDEARQFVEQAKAAIIASLPPSLTNSYTHRITTEDLLVYEVGLSDDGKLQFELAWNPAAVWRYSLYSPDDSNGVEDIVALFYKGTKPNRRSVYGSWHDKKVYLSQGWHRSADPFLDDCIRQFNAEHKADGVTLKLSSAARHYR